MICESCEQEKDPYQFCETIEMDGKEITVVFETSAELCRECKGIAIQRAMEQMLK